MASVIGLLLIVILAGLVSPPVDAFTRCEYVYDYFPYCLDFLVGYRALATTRCCNHVKKLNFLAKHLLGPRLICECIEAMVRGMDPPLIAYNIDALPYQCSTQLSFPISSSMDCSTVPA
ncbi:non-specific lipid-transfer protein 13-like [Punica granatum]|uniref:Non-specific lipid-transfer protein 13-like n=1 Tax=Punica granatum TaxID=22663 RepID=A0A6P8DC15_PUNGR|nr:non-specific lipid-transfer protein 13-like [Punica granatum]